MARDLILHRRNKTVILETYDEDTGQVSPLTINGRNLPRHSMCSGLFLRGRPEGSLYSAPLARRPR